MIKGLAKSKINEPVTVVCYGDEEKMTRREAMEKYYDCMYCSEGAEHERYERIFFQLLEGYTECRDDFPIFGGF